MKKQFEIKEVRSIYINGSEVLEGDKFDLVFEDGSILIGCTLTIDTIQETAYLEHRIFEADANYPEIDIKELPLINKIEVYARD